MTQLVVRKAFYTFQKVLLKLMDNAVCSVTIILPDFDDMHTSLYETKDQNDGNSTHFDQCSRLLISEHYNSSTKLKISRLNFLTKQCRIDDFKTENVIFFFILVLSCRIHPPGLNKLMNNTTLQTLKFLTIIIMTDVFLRKSLCMA